ncbi:hypothetical protein BCR24_06870 [Enterococcus ureilyticus]|uniref:TipC family immunity protein n=1 Tax=Enterococcus ureilyticus TaxID=1131292 RepID=A0A1E5H9I3_9ENTE|nr:TipC family immunity protein [Enterococcus ureilyticus]OEG21587.1 hypothetical protein BCR24_06870 [Enterococcus ureilyticus]
MKKRLIIVFILLITIWVGYKSLEYLKIKNVFDEIYSGEYDDLGYVLNLKGFPKMKQIEWWDRKTADTNNVVGPVIESYKEEYLENGESLSISFMFSKKEFYIGYTKKIDSNISYEIGYRYDSETKILNEDISIIDDNIEKWDIEKANEIQKYFDKYNISKKEVQIVADKVLYNKVIKDWINTYPSRFSAKNIGKLIIKKDPFLE